MRIEVYATRTFEGFHRWPEAPAEVAYLRDRHRHLFHVRATVQVDHDNRAAEFHLLSHRVGRAITALQVDRPTETWSCERWAAELVERCQLDRCEVSEDGENGAVVSR